jgi:hypothetical protein
MHALDAHATFGARERDYRLHRQWRRVSGFEEVEFL